MELWLSTFSFFLATITFSRSCLGNSCWTADAGRRATVEQQGWVYSMEKLFRSGRALSPWLALAAPLLLSAILMTLRAVAPDLFCVEINPGGKETICGSAYSHVNIRRLQLFGFLAWVLLIMIGGAEVLRNRATRSAAIGWSVSALLLVSLVILWLSLPVEDCP